MNAISITILVIASNIAHLNAQTAGGTSAGSSGGGSPGTGATSPRPSTPASPNNPGTPANPQNGNESGQPPSAPATTASSSDGTVSVSNPAANATNAAGGTSNQFGFQTNQFGSNGFGFNTNTGGFLTNEVGMVTNQFGTNALTPTGGATNRIQATNSFGLTNSSTGNILRDQAITTTDRQLLAQLHAAVLGGNPTAQQLAGAPVHFIIANGVVRLVGEVPSMEQRQQIETSVQQVPGVVRIFNALNVAGQPALGVNVVPGNTPPNALAPTSEPGRPPTVFPGSAPSSPQPPGLPGTSPGTSTP